MDLSSNDIVYIVIGIAVVVLVGVVVFLGGWITIERDENGKLSLTARGAEKPGRARTEIGKNAEFKGAEVGEMIGDENPAPGEEPRDVSVGEGMKAENTKIDRMVGTTRSGKDEAGPGD